MRIYRTIESLFNDSVRSQILDNLLFAYVDGGEGMDIFEMCGDEESLMEALRASFALLDEGIVYEKSNLLHLSPMAVNVAKVEAGFFLEEDLDLLPEGTKVMCLSERTEEMLENNSLDDVVEYLSHLIMPQLEDQP